MTLIILQPPLYGLKCSCKVLSGGTTRAAGLPGRLPRRRGPCARNQARPPRLDRCKFVLLRACKPRRRLTSRTRRGRRPPRAARQDQPAGQSAKRVQADPRPFLDGSVNAAACRTHVFQNFNLFKLFSSCPFAMATQLRPTNGKSRRSLRK